MKITKGNEVREVSPKTGKIAIHLMGWAEVTESTKPSEIGTRTRRIEPPIITAGSPIKLKEPEKKVDDTFPGAEAVDEQSEPVKAEKKTRKSPVKSKSNK